MTIRSDEKQPYFQTLERAQVDGDMETLGEFLALHIKQAVDIAKTSGPTAGRRRTA